MVYTNGIAGINSYTSQSATDAAGALKITSTTPSTYGKTDTEKLMLTVAARMNEIFGNIMNMSQIMSTGKGVENMAATNMSNISLNGSTIATMNSAGGGNANAAAQMLAFKDHNQGKTYTTTKSGSVTTYTITGGGGDYITLDSSSGLQLSGDGTNISIDNATLSLVDTNSIMESPGTLFLIQQMLAQMKDALSAVGASGKVSSDVKKEAVQNFQKGVSQ